MNNLNEKIKSKLSEVKPKPKWENETKIFIKNFVVLALILFAVVILGIIIYIISNTVFLFTLSPKVNFLNLLISFPWGLTVLLLLIIFAIIHVVKKIDVFYRYPSWMILVVVLIGLGFGFGVGEAVDLSERAAHFTPINKIYKNQGKLFIDKEEIVVHGKIENLRKNSFDLKTITDELINFKYNNEIIVRPKFEQLGDGKDATVLYCKCGNEKCVQAVKMVPKLRGR